MTISKGKDQKGKYYQCSNHPKRYYFSPSGKSRAFARVRQDEKNHNRAVQSVANIFRKMGFEVKINT